MGRTERIDTVFETFDERFVDVGGDRWVERIFSDGRWTEGPAYFPASRSLLFSDIPNDRVMRWDETTGAVGEFLRPAHHANGHTVDRRGRLVSCEHSGRRVTRTEHDGSVTVLADRVGGNRFNSPNDVVEHSDGSIWFTDPSYGIDSDHEGVAAPSELDGCHVYRIAVDGSVETVRRDFDRPNGLAFSLDERVLYVSDSERRHLRRFDVDLAAGPDATLSGGEVIAESDAGTYDGMRLDTAGRIWIAAGDGVHVLSPTGELLGKLRLPEVTSNLEFGGLARDRLFVTATTSVYTLRVDVSAPPRVPVA